ncbi:MAG: Acetyltransf 6 protein [Patescibacteria group bacterium]|nr:Acetyltransf 6 protein [Patescibacteria group bacterium]
MRMQTSIYTDSQIFTDLQTEWLDLQGRSVTNYVFQSPQFQGAWWNTLGEGELSIITVRDENNQLVGLAPLYMQQNDQGKKELCFIGCVNVSDYLDILVDSQHQTQVYESLTKVLTEELTDWECMFLCSLPESSPTRDWLKQTFHHSTEKQQDVSPFIRLPASWDEYLASIDRKQRHEIKRKMRRVEETDHAFECITSPTDAATAIQDFITLHKASSAEKRDFWDDNHFKFFSTFIPAAGEAGWLKLYFLKIGAVRASAMLIFDYNDQFLLYNSGFDPAQFNNLSTGNVLTAYTIKQAIEQRKTVYDFLRGDEVYKFRFGAVSQPVYDISVER